MNNIKDLMIGWIIQHPEEKYIQCKPENAEHLNFLTESHTMTYQIYGFRLEKISDTKARIWWDESIINARKEIDEMYNDLLANIGKIDRRVCCGYEPKEYITHLYERAKIFADITLPVQNEFHNLLNE